MHHSFIPDCGAEQARDRLREEVGDAFTSILGNPHKPRTILIKAPPAIGKTTTVKELLSILRNRLSVAVYLPTIEMSEEFGIGVSDYGRNAKPPGNLYGPEVLASLHEDDEKDVLGIREEIGRDPACLTPGRAEIAADELLSPSQSLCSGCSSFALCAYQKNKERVQSEINAGGVVRKTHAHLKFKAHRLREDGTSEDLETDVVIIDEYMLSALADPQKLDDEIVSDAMSPASIAGRLFAFGVYVVNVGKEEQQKRDKVIRLIQAIRDLRDDPSQPVSDVISRGEIARAKAVLTDSYASKTRSDDLRKEAHDRGWSYATP